MTKMDIFSKQPDTSNPDNSGYESRVHKISNMQMNLRKATDHIPTPFLCVQTDMNLPTCKFVVIVQLSSNKWISKNKERGVIGGPVIPKKPDLPRVTLQSKTSFLKRKVKKIVSDENFQYFSFSKGGLIDLEWLNLPRNTVIKDKGFFKKTWEKILGSESLTFKRGSIRIRMTWFA